MPFNNLGFSIAHELHYKTEICWASWYCGCVSMLNTALAEKGSTEGEYWKGEVGPKGTRGIFSFLNNNYQVQLPTLRSNSLLPKDNETFIQPLIKKAENTETNFPYFQVKPLIVSLWHFFMLVCAIMCRTFHNQKKSIYHSLIKGGDFSFLWKMISEKMSSFSSSLPNVKGHQLEKMFNTPFHAVYKPTAFRNLHFPGHCVLPFIWIFGMPDSEPLYLLSKFPE